MSTNPSLNYLLQSNDKEQLDEPQSKTRLTLENPSLTYLMNPTEEQKQPTKPLTNPSLQYLMGSEQLTTTKETLQDLRDDKEFQERSERFLSSLDEGETVDDVFGYFRGADYNIADTTKTYFQSEKFTEEQKQDYAYLRDRFDNAEVGGFVEGLKATSDIGLDIISDPTILASVFFVPWTGGTSLAARIATGKAAQEGLKKLTSAKVAKKVSKGVKKVPFQSLPQKLSKNTVATIAATEGFLWGSTNNYLNQNIDVTVGRLEEVSPTESLAIGAVTASIPFALRGTGAGVTKFKNSVADSRAARIEGEADYEGSVFDISVEKYDEIIDGVLPNYRRLSGFVNKPTNALIGEAGSEYVIRSDQMDQAMRRYAKGARGQSVIDGVGGSEDESGNLVGAGAIDVRFDVQRINAVDYVTAQQFEQGIRSATEQGARKGEQMTLRRLQTSPNTRKRIGV